MSTTPKSYLHTLAKDEAIAFVTSLQKVKEHLSHEVQWISTQAQQKTTQLQGIETLLSEALSLGLLDAKAQPKATPSATKTDTSSVAANGNRAAAVSTPEPLATPNGDVAPTIAPAVAKPPTPQKRNSKPQPQTTKASRGPKPSAPKPSVSKPSAKAKTSAPPAKKTSSVTVLDSKKSKPKKAVGLQQFLQRQFREKSLTDAVSEILDRTQKPLSADDIMAKLYEGLSSGDYKRAKNSVTNILSVGRSKGKWKSTGRGLYAGSAVTASKG